MNGPTYFDMLVNVISQMDLENQNQQATNDNQNQIVLINNNTYPNQNQEATNDNQNQIVPIDNNTYPNQYQEATNDNQNQIVPIDNKIHIPLQFWFARSSLSGLSAEEIIHKLSNEDVEFKKKYQKLFKCLITNDPIEEYGNNFYENIYNDIDYLENQYRHKRGTTLMYPPMVYMQDFYDMVNKFCKKYDNVYESELHMSECEIINGYKLYNIIDGGCFMRKYSYDKFIKHWNENKHYDQKKFLSSYKKKTCTGWGKVDKNGDYYVGYYNYPEGSYERNNAYFLTRKANGLALWDLPYPKKVVLKTIRYGCATSVGKESPRYCNFLCEWVKRKMEQMSKVPVSTLKSLCIKKIKENKIDVKNINDVLIDDLFDEI